MKRSACLSNRSHGFFMCENDLMQTDWTGEPFQRQFPKRLFGSLGSVCDFRFLLEPTQDSLGGAAKVSARGLPSG